MVLKEVVLINMKFHKLAVVVILSLKK